MSPRRFLHLLLALTLWSTQTFVSPAVCAASPSAQEASRTQSATGNAQPNSDAADLAARLAAIEKAVEEKLKETGVPGASLVVVKGDQVLLARGFGHRDAARKVPVTPDTLFAIGSCTKAVTAMAAAMSADDGRLSLDDSPKKFLPYFKLRDAETDAKITLRDLLSHTSGLPGADISWYTGVLSREEVIRVMANVQPTAKLREKWQYQNVMFSAAGEAVARAQNSTWEEVVSRRILRPLGMNATVLSAREMQKAADYSLGYELDAETKQARPVPTRDLTNVAPAGSINSNARDMAQWLRLMLGGSAFAGRRLVSEKGFAELLRPQMKLDDKTDYGLGWVLTSADGLRLALHTGGIDGFGALVALVPEHKLGVAVLTNVPGTSLRNDTLRAVVRGLVARPAADPTGAVAAAANATAATLAPAPPAPAVEPQKEAGRYKFAEAGFDVEIVFKDGKLLANVPGQPQYTLEHLGGRRYRLAPLEGFFVTFRPAKEGGAETEIYLEQPHGNYVLPRLKDEAPKPPAAAPISVEELMAKRVAAEGGEAALRKHKSSQTRGGVTFVHQGLEGETVISARAPNAWSRELTFKALGKEIGWAREFFDGAAGGEETSFSPGNAWGGRKLAEARAEADFYALLNWKTLYKTAAVKEMSKVGGEEAYVVVLTPERGQPVTEYVSAKTFLLLRRDTQELGGTGEPLGSVTAVYGNYRNVDGVMVPFTITYQVPGTGESVVRVREVKFDVPLGDETFRPRAAKR